MSVAMVGTWARPAALAPRHTRPVAHSRQHARALCSVAHAVAGWRRLTAPPAQARAMSLDEEVVAAFCAHSVDGSALLRLDKSTIKGTLGVRKLGAPSLPLRQRGAATCVRSDVARS